MRNLPAGWSYHRNYWGCHPAAKIRLAVAVVRRRQKKTVAVAVRRNQKKPAAAAAAVADFGKERRIWQFTIHLK